MASSPSRRRPALIVFVVIAFAACLALGWWQWTRFESAGGTGQNLGYAFQWPLFAAFVVYAYRRFVQLEDTAPEDRPAVANGTEPREIPVDLLPQRTVGRTETLDAANPDDEAHQAYNNYLAQLRAADRSTT
ncbi:transcriptional regulator [Rhodococcus spelaei]|uniref:Transcriptional regulator n=1 Tax=Rhodococcus spelaei TaxID=2546320 RepID=A0A541B4H8_9NOCA|nr:transcriptional regulator [Rhodococcus spelaei]TQF67218.1 transcriptional regulator [Rhodococcus spelaei]